MHATGRATDLDSYAEGQQLLRQGELVDSKGIPYRQFRHRLRPRFFRVWLDISLCYAALAMLVVAAACADLLLDWWGLLLAPFLALPIGWMLSCLLNFLHEAVHFNIAPDKRWNDRLANVFIGALFARDVRQYRTVHMDHHRFLGTPQDTENAYFDSLNLRFLIEGLFGVKAVRATLKNRRVAQTAATNETPVRFWPMLCAGMLLNGELVGGSFLLGFPTVAASWVLGMLLVFPLVGALRQLLEHRAQDAETEADYRVAAHGPVSRLFGSGLVASTLGSAGFNRHLLHHWEPQVSYTRLAELEAYLRDTALGPCLEPVTTSYTACFLSLFRASGRRPADKEAA
jgi:fatty acid desaturase